MATIDKITVSESGVVHVRILKDDGTWHRTTIEPGVSPDEHMKGNPTVEMDEIRARCGVEHTATVVTAYRELESRIPGRRNRA